jgi:hypothetical protein
MSARDEFTHMEEAWRLEGNPFPSEGIRQSPEQPFSPAVFPEETSDFYRKLVRGAILGSKGIGFLWSQGVGGDTGYGKTTLMQTASRQINTDLGATVLQNAGMRPDRLVPIAAVYTNLNNLNSTGLYPVLFDGVADAATPLTTDTALFDKARTIIAERVGDDAAAISAAVITARQRIAPAGVPLRPELVAAFAVGGANGVLTQLSSVSQASRLRNGLHYIDFLLAVLAAASIDHLFIFVDQLEDLATNKSINSAKRSREIGRIRDLLEGGPYAGRLHFVFTFHNTAAQVLERFWEVNRLPRFEIAPDNTASVVVLRGLSNDDQVAELLKVYLTDKRTENVDDELLPFEPDALSVLRDVSRGRVGILLAKAHELLNAGAEAGLPRISGEFASNYFQGVTGAADSAAADTDAIAVGGFDIDDILLR